MASGNGSVLEQKIAAGTATYQEVLGRARPVERQDRKLRLAERISTPEPKQGLKASTTGSSGPRAPERQISNNGNDCPPPCGADSARVSSHGETVEHYVLTGHVAG